MSNPVRIRQLHVHVTGSFIVKRFKYLSMIIWSLRIPLSILRCLPLTVHRKILKRREWSRWWEVRWLFTSYLNILLQPSRVLIWLPSMTIVEYSCTRRTWRPHLPLVILTNRRYPPSPPSLSSLPSTCCHLAPSRVSVTPLVCHSLFHPLSCHLPSFSLSPLFPQCQ